jgi:hypothetical protein
LDTALILGAIGAATGVGSALFTVYAWRTERSDRERQFAAQQELDLARYAAESEERLRSRKADITATQTGVSNSSDDPNLRIFEFTLRNMGPSYAKHVQAYLIDSQGRARSSRPMGRPLNPGESLPVTLYVPKIAWDPPAALRLVVAWYGEGGVPHEEVSNLTVQHEIHPQLRAGGDG